MRAPLDGGHGCSVMLEVGDGSVVVHCHRGGVLLLVTTAGGSRGVWGGVGGGGDQSEVPNAEASVVAAGCDHAAGKPAVGRGEEEVTLVSPHTVEWNEGQAIMQLARA